MKKRTAIAIVVLFCLSPLLSRSIDADTVRHVDNSRSISVNSGGNVLARCPKGTTLTGGGYQMGTGFERLNIRASTSNIGDKGWIVIYDYPTPSDPSTSTDNVTLIVRAICLSL